MDMINHSTKEVAECFGIKRARLQQWILNGYFNLPFIGTGNKRAWTTKDVCLVLIFKELIVFMHRETAAEVIRKIDKTLLRDEILIDLSPTISLHIDFGQYKMRVKRIMRIK